MRLICSSTPSCEVAFKYFFECRTKSPNLAAEAGVYDIELSICRVIDHGHCFAFLVGLWPTR